MLSMILRGGRLVDGTGRPGFVGDIGIDGDRIAAIGDLSDASSLAEFDVSGLTVTPGFIDVHTHSDAVLLADGKADSQVLQGVTTEFAGQCGFSFAPVGDPRAIEKWMVGRLPGVDVTWTSFGDYLDTLEQKALGVNLLALVGHGALRYAVMGDEQRSITEDEVQKMERLLEQSIDEGAWGMSTGLEYWPGLGADVGELTRLSKLVARVDGLHASHVRNRDVHYDLGFMEVLSVGRAASVRTQISHIQPKYGRPQHAMVHSLAMIDHARAHGVDVGFDVIPHDWSHTAVAAMLPAWARQGGVERLLERLADPKLRQAMKANKTPMWRIVLEEKWDRVRFLRSRHAALVGKSVAEIAAARDVAPWDLVLDLLLDEGEDALHMLWTSQSFFEEDIVEALAHPMCAVMSDTLALCRHGPTGGLIGSLSGFGWAARFLQHYVREQALMSLEEGVRRITSLPAERIGLRDRGTLRVGAKADIASFDFAAVTYTGSLEQPKEHPTGFRYVIVNGRLAVDNGKRTLVDAGVVLRRAA